MSHRFSEKIAVVTGAAGEIGRAIAVALGREGATIVAADLKDAPIDQTTAAVEAAGAEISTVALDVANSSDWERVVAEAASRFGGIDILINNAGVEGVVAPIEDSPEDVFDRVMAVNVKGVFLGMKAVIPQIKQRGGGSIVNMASVAGFAGDSGVAPYIASKHAVIGLTKSAATQGGPENIRVNAVCPSPIETRMMRSLEEGFAPGAASAAKEMISQRIPLGRYGTPEEVAAVVTFLCSDDARFVSGSMYTVDGGMINH